MEPKSKRIYYGWYVVAISFVMMSISYAVYNSWPIFYVPILNELGWSRGETALIFSLGSLVYGFSSPIAGYLIDRFGPRKLFTAAAIVLAGGAAGASQSSDIWQLCLFYGVMVAVATICVGVIPITAIITNWFVRKRATALGIAQAGSQDAFLLAPLIQFIILALGWRYAYLVLAVAVIAFIIPLTQFLRMKPQDMGLLPDGEMTIQELKNRQTKTESLIIDKKWAATDWTLLRAMKEYRFWALFAIMFGAGFSFRSLVNHLVALTTDIGFTAIFAATLLTIYAVTTITGRFCGFISDYLSREVTFTLGIMIILLTLPILLFANRTISPWFLYIFIGCFGFGSGLYMPAYIAGTADLFQGRHFGTIVGMANMGFGLAASLGTWLYGYIFDVTGSYKLAIIITWSVICLTIITMWIASPRTVRRVNGRGLKTK